MARTKEFDPVEALDRALKVFWCHGYERTSVSMLLDEMGINRGSLYDTFGDKHSLFVDCLARYRDVYMAHVIAALSQDTPVRPTLEILFRSVTERVHEDNRSWGCLMTNTANELSLHDTAVATIVTQNFERLEQAFTRFLAQGQRSGAVAASIDVQAKGRFLTGSFAGIATLSKTNLGPAFMQDVIQNTLAFLD
jgi:TetR/AcrR family transcriptional regulator, transcriptional repressor for nem operon